MIRSLLRRYPPEPASLDCGLTCRQTRHPSMRPYSRDHEYRRHGALSLLAQSHAPSELGIGGFDPVDGVMREALAADLIDPLYDKAAGFGGDARQRADRPRFKRRERLRRQEPTRPQCSYWRRRSFLHRGRWEWLIFRLVLPYFAALGDDRDEREQAVGMAADTLGPLAGARTTLAKGMLAGALRFFERRWQPKKDMTTLLAEPPDGVSDIGKADKLAANGRTS